MFLPSLGEAASVASPRRSFLALLRRGRHGMIYNLWFRCTGNGMFCDQVFFFLSNIKSFLLAELVLSWIITSRTKIGVIKPLDH